MSKIVYPESEKLAKLVQSSVQDTLQSLNSAIGQCSFVVPKDFPYLNYVRNLGATIAGHKHKLNGIVAIINSIDNNYSALMDKMDSYKESIDTTILEKRDRLVK